MKHMSGPASDRRPRCLKSVLLELTPAANVVRTYRQVVPTPAPVVRRTARPRFAVVSLAKHVIATGVRGLTVRGLSGSAESNGCRVGKGDETPHIASARSWGYRNDG